MQGESKYKNAQYTRDGYIEPYFLVVKLNFFEVTSILQVDRGILVDTLLCLLSSKSYYSVNVVFHEVSQVEVAFFLTCAISIVCFK